MSAICANAVMDAGARRAKAIGATTTAGAPAAVVVAVAAAGAAEGAAAAVVAAAEARNRKIIPGILRERNPLLRTPMPRKSVTSVNKLGTLPQTVL